MKISLIILTYNYPTALAHIFESLIRQTVQPHEVIIADDGSAQETADVIIRYQSVCPFAVHHIWQEKKGFRISLLRNKGIAKSKGDYLIFSDGDRALHPCFIEDFTKNARPGEAKIGGRSFFTRQYTEQILSVPFSLKNYTAAPRRAFEKNYINSFHLSFLIPLLPVYREPKMLNGGLVGLFREDVMAVDGFDAAYEGWGREDSDFLIRLLHKGIAVKKLKFAGITYHLWHPSVPRDNLSANDRLLEEVIRERRTQPRIGVSALTDC